jgi:polyisoprenoid-binding protein YceI
MPATQTIEKYSIDPVHTNVEFVVRHLMIAKVRGRFSSISGEIDATSVDTREEQRDAHLRSADFFDTETFRQLTFAGTAIENVDGDAFDVRGNLTIHGVTREVVLKAQFEGRGSDPWGGKRIGYSAEAKISRKDYGLVWNQALETGGIAVGDEVKIEINAEAVLQQK